MLHRFAALVNLLELFDYSWYGVVKLTEEDDLLEKEVPLTTMFSRLSENATHALLKD